MAFSVVQGRIPGTDKWRPISEDPEATEDFASGTLIIRIRENLDFGSCHLKTLPEHFDSWFYLFSQYGTTEGYAFRYLTLCMPDQCTSGAERLRRLELYGHDRSHPSDEPRRPQATVLIFHMADVETVDASYVCGISLTEVSHVRVLQSRATLL